MLLVACATASMPVVVADEGKLADIVPLPTPPDKLQSIANYLEKAPADPGLDVLATEWERLDEGVRIARGKGE